MSLSIVAKFESVARRFAMNSKGQNTLIGKMQVCVLNISRNPLLGGTPKTTLRHPNVPWHSD